MYHCIHKGRHAYVCLLYCILIFHATAYCQHESKKAQLNVGDTSLDNSTLLHYLPFYSKSQLDSLDLDGVSKKQLYALVQTAIAKKILAPQRNFRKIETNWERKRLLQFGGGYLSYNWNYRSNIDTPYLEKNIAQHFITGAYNVTIAESLPVRFIYFGRQSNSLLFRDYHDFRVEFNAPEFQRLRAKKLTTYIQQYLDRIEDPLLKPSIDVVNKNIINLEDWQHQTPVINRLLEARETVVSSKAKVVGDTSLQRAKQFISFYEKIDQQKNLYIHKRDSLLQTYIGIQKKVQTIKSLTRGANTSKQMDEMVQYVLDSIGLPDKRIRKLVQAFSSVKSLAVGKSIPSYSDLTLRNVSVNGINFEYNKRQLYFAATVGSVDYQFRDFAYKRQHKTPQYLYSLRLGYGQRDQNNIIFSFFGGKKQLLSSMNSNGAQQIFGVSLSSQIQINKDNKLNVEIAQSAAPKVYAPVSEAPKSNFNLKDHSSTAYAVSLRSYIPLLKVNFAGSYQRAGVDYQSFTAYKVHSDLERWSIRGEQQLWRRQLILAAGIQKNNFENPYIVQRYSANTLFKNLSITLRKKNGPSATFGYMPSSQYTFIDSQLTQSHYQILTAVVQHQYKIGMAQAVSSVIYSKFFNNRYDSGFIFYNSSNYYLTQVINFPRYSATLNIAHANNEQYVLNTLDVGINARLFRQDIIGFGTKVNQLNGEQVKVGFYGNAGFEVPKVGSFSVRLEKSYLPGLSQPLIKSDFYNIGFTRYIQ